MFNITATSISDKVNNDDLRSYLSSALIKVHLTLLLNGGHVHLLISIFFGINHTH